MKDASMSRLVVGLVQMQSGLDKEENLLTAERLVNEAARRGASVVALPEYFSFGAMGPLQRENAEPVPGPTVERLCRMAGAARVFLVGGTLAERLHDTDKVFNTSVLINPRGEITAKYRKIHLFNLETDGQTIISESAFLEAGDNVVTAKTDPGVLGLTICYDLRFPEIYRALTLRGAGIIFVVSSFMDVTGKDHWEPLLRARAIENQVFIAAPNQAGPVPGANQLRHGHTMIIDPWGRVLAQASEAEEVITAEIDFEYLESVRKQLPSLSSRRPEVYRRISWL